MTNAKISLVGKGYKLHSAFDTIQGEGINLGRRAIFLRFSGCNVWNGLESGRAKGLSACAKVCDTKFFSSDPEQAGGTYQREQLKDLVEVMWDSKEKPFVVLTGGEPSLQADEALCDYLAKFFTLAMETNGQGHVPMSVSHVCLSPKPPVEIFNQHYDEVKVLFPLYDPRLFTSRAETRWVQPVEDANWNDNVEKAIVFVQENPEWRLSIQAHKFWGIR